MIELSTTFYKAACTFSKSPSSFCNQVQKVCGLVLNVVTIVSVCASSMIADRIAQFEAQSGHCVVKQLIEHFSKKPIQKQEMSSAWLWAEFLLNFSSTSLFVANLIQMCFIGKFVVNRIPFDK